MTADLPAPIATLLGAVGAGDTEAFLAGFTPQGTVDDWGREFTGPDAIRRWSDAEFIGKQVTLDVVEAGHQEAEYEISAKVGGNGFNGPSRFLFLVAGDKVERMTIRQ